MLRSRKELEDWNKYLEETKEEEEFKALVNEGIKQYLIKSGSVDNKGNLIRCNNCFSSKFIETKNEVGTIYTHCSKCNELLLRDLFGWDSMFTIYYKGSVVDFE